MLKVFHDLFPSTTKYIKRNVYNLICKQQEEKNTLSIQQVIKMGGGENTTVKLKRKNIKRNKQLCNILFQSQLECK